MYFFTADEHYGHSNIIEYCNRPFDNIKNMDSIIIENHNSIVSKNDCVIHAGDFSLLNNIKDVHDKYINKLNGHHIFIMGSHDYWLKSTKYQYIWTIKEKAIFIVICHYAMRTWERSHWNSWQLFGHSHGTLDGVGKQIDIGVDTNNFYPYSLNEISDIMNCKPNNFNFIGKRK